MLDSECANDPKKQRIAYHEFVFESEFFEIKESLIPGAGKGLFIKDGVCIDERDEEMMDNVAVELMFHSPVWVKSAIGDDGVPLPSVEKTNGYLVDVDELSKCKVNEMHYRSLASFANEAVDPFIPNFTLNFGRYSEDDSEYL